MYEPEEPGSVLPACLLPATHAPRQPAGSTLTGPCTPCTYPAGVALAVCPQEGTWG